MRDHRKLQAFWKSKELALKVYQATQSFPGEERFGLTVQMRRAAVSVASNLVEGCARRSERDFVRFLDIAAGSARELEFQIELAQELGYLSDNGGLLDVSRETCRLVTGLMRSFLAPPEKHVTPQPSRRPPSESQSPHPQDPHRRLQTEDPRLKTED